MSWNFSCHRFMKLMCTIAILCFACILSLPAVYTIFLISFSSVIQSSFLSNSLYLSSAFTWLFTSVSHRETTTVYRLPRLPFSTFYDFKKSLMLCSLTHLLLSVGFSGTIGTSVSTYSSECRHTMKSLQFLNCVLVYSASLLKVFS